MDAEQLGAALAVLLLFAGGLALVISGARRRKEPTTRRSGRNRQAVGALLVLMSVLSGTGAAGEDARKQETVRRTSVELPATLLGLPRNDALLGGKRTQLLEQIGADLARVDAAAYGTATDKLIVLAGTGRFDHPESELADAADGIARPDVEVDAGREVPVGALGGEGRCWGVHGFGTGAQACAFVSSSSLVMVFDFVAVAPAEAALRALAVRQAAVQVEGVTPAPVTLASVSAAVPAVRVALPPSLLGLRLDRTVAKAERAAFVAESVAAGLRDADLGLYRGTKSALLVQVAAGDFTADDLVVKVFAQQLAGESGKPIGAPVSVDPGPLGGRGACWKVDLDGPTVVCLLFDESAYVGVFDLDATDVARTAARARQVRAAVEHRQG